jgi:hypothetical protein
MQNFETDNGVIQAHQPSQRQPWRAAVDVWCWASPLGLLLRCLTSWPMLLFDC